MTENRNTKLSKNYSVPNLGLFLIVESGSVPWKIWTFMTAVIHVGNQF